MERFEDLDDGSGNRPLLTPIEIENRVTDEVRAGRCASTPAAIVARLVECGLSEDEARQTVNRMKLTQTLPTKGIPVNAHFLDLVKHGEHPGCSSGARAARLLAMAVLDHALGLDNEATRGLVEWLTWSRQFPTTARDYLEQ